MALNEPRCRGLGVATHLPSTGSAAHIQEPKPCEIISTLVAMNLRHAPASRTPLRCLSKRRESATQSAYLTETCDAVIFGTEIAILSDIFFMERNLCLQPSLAPVRGLFAVWDVVFPHFWGFACLSVWFGRMIPGL